VSARREALIGRFRATAADRLVRVHEALAEAIGSGSMARFSAALGELHTIKGESKMLGFSAMSRFTHALEQELSGEETAKPELLRGAERATSLLERALRGEIDGEGALAEAAALLEEKGLAAFDASAWTPASAPERSEPKPVHASARWTRVEASRVDRICDLVGEVGALLDRLRSGLAAMQEREDLRSALRELSDETERVLPKMRELEASSWALRLVPVEPELVELSRHGRDIAEQSGKRVSFVLEASGAQLERQVLDGLTEPLLHLVRNAVDHGIEPVEARGDKPAEAAVRITAESSGASVILSVEDDGRGLSTEALRSAAVERGLSSAEAVAALSEERVRQLIFEPGFSTRRLVSEVSGRGVGLDVVRRRVEEVGGSLRVDSIEGAGTRFELTVPATITRERFVVIEVAGALYGIPARMVRRIAQRDREAEDTVAGGRIVRDEQAPVPLRELAGDLGQASDEGGSELLLWMDSGSNPFAWTVPSVLGERELIRRALDPILSATGILAGSAMLEDGRLVLLLRVSEVLRRSGSARVDATHAGDAGASARVLVVDDSPIIRDLLAELLRDVGLVVETAADGAEAIERVDRRVPDLVLTDLEMPRMDGFGLVHAIRSRGLSVPVVVVSTRGSEEDRRRASDLGASAYIVKTGFEGSALLETVSRFVAVRA
jgi:two-component system, chemotaxis family, sensor kinase CheA